MKRAIMTTVAATLAAGLAISSADAQSGRPKLHVNPRWKQCSFQLDPSLSQGAWHEFTEEAGLAIYFRPLADARPMGRGHVELSMLQWGTSIDDSKSAWNDTFVHPDSTHWLIEGSGLKIPGLMLRAGVTDRTDVSAYATKSPGANYGFVGGQVAHSFREPESKWQTAARASFVSMYGPADVDFAVYGVDVVASRTVPLTRWISVAPYAGASGYLASSHENSPVVSLSNEHVLGGQGLLGATVQLSKARLGVEYSVARVSSFSIKLGVGL